MKITLELTGQNLRNFERALAVLGWPDAPKDRAGLAGLFVGLAADAVAQAGWFSFPSGCAMTLHRESPEQAAVRLHYSQKNRPQLILLQGGAS